MALDEYITAMVELLRNKKGKHMKLIADKLATIDVGICYIVL